MIIGQKERKCKSTPRHQKVVRGSGSLVGGCGTHLLHGGAQIASNIF
jgi:hypothetical protein